MKPVRLEVRGFTAFREPTTVEFEGRRLFVITGATGAGKSSLLDAMTWALYGRVPRIGAALKELIAQGEREMSVMLEFQVRDRRFRVARRFPSTTGTRLEEILAGADLPRPLADRASDVTKQVEAILGMDYATFTRAIVLPQGEFDSFLRGEAKERRAILSQLIGLGVYEQAGVIARQRASEHRTQVQTFRTLLDESAPATPEALAALRAQLTQYTVAEAALAGKRQALVRLRELATEERDRQKVAAQASTEAAEAAEDLTAARKALADTTRRRDESSTRVDEVTASLTALAYDRDMHGRLKAQVALLDQHAAAEEALAAAQRDLADAERIVLDAAAAAGAAADVLKAAQATSKAATAEARAAEKALATVAGKGLRARVSIEEGIAALDRDRERLEADAHALEQRIRDLEALAATLKAAADDRARAEQHVARATNEVDTAAKAAARASTAREKAAATASQAEAVLARARTVDAAAHIRATLKPGDVCPVCGEVVDRVSKHRAPAGLGAAEKAHAEAQSTLTAAVTAEHAAATALASAQARTEGTAQALEAARAREAAVHRQAEALAAAPEGLGDAVKTAKAAVVAGTEALAAARAQAASRRMALAELRDALARVPDGIAPVESKRATVTAEDVGGAIESHRAAAQARDAAVRAEEHAAREEASARREVTGAEREAERAGAAHVEAQRRLAGLGGMPGKPEAVRRALADADARATEAEQLAEALRAAREALASAGASLDAAGGAVQQAQARLDARAQASTAAMATVEEAHCAFACAWTETLGETRPPSVAALREVMEEHEAERERVRDALKRAAVAIEVAEAQIEQATSLRGRLAEHQAAADLNGAVATELRGDRFIAFLLHESMQLLALDASVRLAEFTSGRYTLVADGDDFKVVDRLNGDEQRSVKTLSGGETFLASLALSLALSEHLADISGTGGAISLDSLFLDEGFGALDPESLDLAVQGLETLAEGSRMIGVISHVEELAERLPDRIRVEKGARGSTVVA